MIYVDSGILVKLLTVEPDSGQWRGLLSDRRDLVTSQLALPEVRSALRQKVMVGFVKRSYESSIWEEFQQSIRIGKIQIFSLDSAVIEETLGILERMPRTIPLRTLDALHLATARLFKCSAVATTDLRMRAAAGELAMKLL